jgi:hypothetical protein
MKGALVVLALVASLASLVSADETKGSGSWTVRTLYSSLASRLGNPPAVLEYTVEEHHETGIASERVALDRARTIAREGFEYAYEGRLIVVPPARVELVEVFEVP